MGKVLRAAIWARVSTDDQETENQLQALREWAQNRGFKVVLEYSIHESAYNGKHQARLNEALQDARLGKFDLLLTWSLDRISREGIEPTLSVIRRFRERGVRLLSLQEDWTDVPEEMQPMFISFYAWVARQESARRSERVKAGLARRRLNGDPVGRQPGAVDKKKRKRSGYHARWERERESAH